MSVKACYILAHMSDYIDGFSILPSYFLQSFKQNSVILTQQFVQLVYKKKISQQSKARGKTVIIAIPEICKPVCSPCVITDWEALY